MSAPDTPRDPFAALRDAGARILETQHAREPGPAAALLADVATADHGDALAVLRRCLDELDPPAPAPSEAVTADLLRAAEFVQTADPADEGERREAVRLLRAALDPPAPAAPAPVAVRNVTGDPPRAVLSIPRHDGRRDGAVLSVGTVALLAGAGGASKTTLSLQIALTAAATADGADREACGGALIVAGGPVILATYEDALPVLRDRTLRMAERGGASLTAGLDRLHLLDLAGWPLYGPPDGMGYSAPPGPAPGWAPLWQAVEATGARLVIVDPALAAFTGESNAAGPVRSFIGALAAEAAKRRAAVLLIAHSTKAARTRSNGTPDVYDPGQIGGSSHWTDGARGALSLTRDAVAPDRHRLAIVKANYGPSLVSVTLSAARTAGGALVGLDARDGVAWQHGDPKPDPKPDKATGAPAAPASNGKENPFA